MMQANFFERVEACFSAERLQAYAVAQSGGCADPTVTLARYLLNMALCESLYSPLQICEIALRNAIHRQITLLMSREDWYDSAQFQLTAWAQAEVLKAKNKIARNQKPISAGRVIAELQFGFWTSLFEAHYEQRTAFLPHGIKAVFPHLPKSLQNRKDRKNDLERIRQLRNRVFHHERIVHWKDLGAQHAHLLQVIAWISPELHQMAQALDRFKAIRAAGLVPWLHKLSRPAQPPIAPRGLATVLVPAPFDATYGTETPFGKRWGGELGYLAPAQLTALQAGQTLALDVMNEYIVFLQMAPKPERMRDTP